MKIENTFGIPKVKSKYPHIIIENDGDELPIIMRSIPEGNLPLLMRRNGAKLKFKEIERSAIVINRLLRLYTLSIVLSPEKTVMISTIEELMNLEEFDWTL